MRSVLCGSLGDEVANSESEICFVPGAAVASFS